MPGDAESRGRDLLARPGAVRSCRCGTRPRLGPGTARGGGQLDGPADRFLTSSRIREEVTRDGAREPMLASFQATYLPRPRAAALSQGLPLIQAYHIVHHRWTTERRALPLYPQSRISEVFAVDIHPGARIGKGILFDHATSVVVDWIRRSRSARAEGATGVSGALG